MMLTKNTLGLTEHVEIIEKARDDVKSGLIVFAVAVANACNQLDNQTQKLLSQELNINQPSLTKWSDIGNDSLLLSVPCKLPAAFGSLYDLTRLHKKLVSMYGKEKGEAKFKSVFTSGKVDAKSTRLDIQYLLLIVENRLDEKNNRFSKNNLFANNKIELTDKEKYFLRVSKDWKKIHDIKQKCIKIITDSSVGKEISSFSKLDEYKDYHEYQHPNDSELRTNNPNEIWVKNYTKTGLIEDLRITALRARMEIWTEMQIKQNTDTDSRVAA